MIQSLLCAPGAQHRQLPAEGCFVDHCRIDLLSELKRQLVHDDAGREHLRLVANIRMLEDLASALTVEVRRCADGSPLGRLDDIGGLRDSGRHLLSAA